jgi:hypothetical protein
LLAGLILFRRRRREAESIPKSRKAFGAGGADHSGPPKKAE